MCTQGESQLLHSDLTPYRRSNVVGPSWRDMTEVREKKLNNCQPYPCAPENWIVRVK